MAPDYQTLYNSLAKALERLQEQINEDKRQILLFEQKERQWEYEKSKQLGIFQQMLDTKNREHNEILQENQRLHEELRLAKE